MNITILDEPDLEFASGGRHIDPRHGISYYGPADSGISGPATVRVGIIGTRDAIQGLKSWLDRCREPIAAKQSRLNHLYLAFPGFATNVGFRSTIVWNTRLERTLDKRSVEALTTMSPHAALHAAVDLYDAELSMLNEEPNCDVVIVCRPDELLDQAPQVQKPGKPWEESAREVRGVDFHSLLKARSLRTSRPIQIIRRRTWDKSFRPADESQIRQQDEATRAWNLHTALYYKAGGVPWRMTRSSKDLTNCYVGVAFYRSADATTLQTSVAQVFNERGDGVIVRGAQASQSREDRQPHLTGDDATELLEQSLARYRSEHRTMPARVILHKASSFTAAEVEGFQAAADNYRIDQLELIWIPQSDPVRLFRRGEHPVLRGTMISLGNERHLLYTRGSVPLYGTYAGMYIPSVLPFRIVRADSSPTEIANELLLLTKMNWNATQLDGRLPITLRTADSIGRILKHIDGSNSPQPRYAYYM